MVGFIKGILTSWGIFLFVSSIIWMLTEDTEKWFFRFIGCIISLGFLGVISAIEEIKNKKDV